MPARRGRPKKGDRRIDAAIDHFTAMGYPARDVREVVADLLEAYGGPDAWPFLEEGSYYVVQEKLIEKQEQEEKLLLLEHHHQQNQEQHQEPAVDQAPPENNMLILEVHNGVPAESESPDEEAKDPMFIEPPALKTAVPLPVAIGTGGTRRPCYGWISESEDEEELIGRQHDVNVVSIRGGLLCKRKRPE
uniref:WIYLD domain-containing protein n=1 Tax=Arundo donax TaxID=35708 RepID=A0A0A9GB33_ARUDO